MILIGMLEVLRILYWVYNCSIARIACTRLIQSGKKSLPRFAFSWEDPNQGANSVRVFILPRQCLNSSSRIFHLNYLVFSLSDHSESFLASLVLHPYVISCCWLAARLTMLQHLGYHVRMGAAPFLYDS